MYYSGCVLTQIILVYRRAYPNRCFYCGSEMEHGLNRQLPTKNIDHVIPKAKGGSNKASNRVPCCRPCNMAKRNLTLNEYREKFGKPFFHETVIKELLAYAADINTPGKFEPPTHADSRALGDDKSMFELLCAAAEGESNKEIAWRWGTTEQTIKNKWTKVKERLGAINVTHAACIAVRRKIIDYDEENMKWFVPGRNTR